MYRATFNFRGMLSKKMLLKSIVYNDGYINNCLDIHDIQSRLIELYNIIDKINFSPIFNYDESMGINSLKEISYLEECMYKYANGLDKTLEFISSVTFIFDGYDITYNFKNGYFHSLEGPAVTTPNFNRYYINGEEFSYMEWLKHPLVRKKKIEKITRNMNYV